MDEKSTPTKGTQLRVPKDTLVPFPMDAIKAKCRECSNGVPSEVRYCPCTDCALWLFRFGCNPKNSTRGAQEVFEQ